MVTLKIETETDSFEDAEVLIKEALRSIRKGSQAGIIGGGIGKCTFDVDLSAAQQNAHLTPESQATSQTVINAETLEPSDSVPPPAQAQVA